MTIISLGGSFGSDKIIILNGNLIEHSKLEYGHCYFKKQPTTADELGRAINAMQVSCIAGIRYSGKDKAILKRLYDLGMQTECDYKLEDLE